MTISNNYSSVLIQAVKHYRYGISQKLDDPEVKNDHTLKSYFSEELMVIDGILDQIYLFVEE